MESKRLFRACDFVKGPDGDFYVKTFFANDKDSVRYWQTEFYRIKKGKSQLPPQVVWLNYHESVAIHDHATVREGLRKEGYAFYVDFSTAIRAASHDRSHV